jgi:genome maintenance exonuclease 1
MNSFQYELLEPIKLQRKNEEGKRLYVTEGGNRYSSVTTSLSYFSRKSIANWRQNVGAEAANKISTQASTFGTAMHNIAEKYVLGELDTKKSNPIALESFRKIQPYLDANVDVIYGIEHQMYSDELKTAGTADLICRYDGKNTLLDFKTSRRRKTRDQITTYFMQCAAYSMMAKERHGLEIEQAVILMAVRDDEPIVFIEDIEPWVKMTRKFFDLYNKGLLR